MRPAVTFDLVMSAGDPAMTFDPEFAADPGDGADPSPDPGIFSLPPPPGAAGVGSLRCWSQLDFLTRNRADWGER